MEIDHLIFSINPTKIWRNELDLSNTKQIGTKNYEKLFDWGRFQIYTKGHFCTGLIF